MKHQLLLNILSWVGKVVGLVSALNSIPGVSPEVGMYIFFVASLIKDTVNRIADFLDDGLVNDSINPKPKTS